MDRTIKPLIIYTMTKGLGDFIIMGDVMKKAELLIPGLRCVMVHRGNPHTRLWTVDVESRRFYSIFSPIQLCRFLVRMKREKKNGYTIFGCQMAPGSLQGFFFYLLLKKIRCIDYIVDFNLINADLITPLSGTYLLDAQLNQLRLLFKCTIPAEYYKLALPMEIAERDGTEEHSAQTTIGLHPWSKRGHLSGFVWPYEEWLKVIRSLLSRNAVKIIIFGKDRAFDIFREFLKKELHDGFRLITFLPSETVKDLIQTIKDTDMLLSVNTSVVHIGYALNKKMVILCGPSLDIWTPKGVNIRDIYDSESTFQGSDKYIEDERFPSVRRIDADEVIRSINSLLAG